MFPVAAISVADLVVEHYDYRFTPAGLPVIELTIMNPSAQTMHADLSVKLSKTIASAQNDYRFKEDGALKAMRGIAFMPGKERKLVLRDAPLLKPGEYEADVRLRHLDDTKTHRMDFGLSREAFAQAKTIRDSSKTTSEGPSSSSLIVSGIFVIVFAALILLAGVRKSRNAIRAKRRKHGNNNP